MLSFSSYARPQDCDSPLGERPQAEALLPLCCVCPSFSRDLPTVLFLLPSLGGVCMWRRGRTGPCHSGSHSGETHGRKRPFKEAAMVGILPLSLPQHHCAPLSARRLGAHLQSTRPFHLSSQLQDTFFQEELGKSSSEEGSFGLESHPYLALPVIHAGRLMFSFECSMVCL